MGISSRYQEGQGAISARERHELIVSHALRTPNYIHDHKGFMCRWSGWRMPYNAISEFGVWIATSSRLQGYAYALTSGRVDHALFPNDLMTLYDSDRRVFKSDGERLSAAVDAFEALLQYLDSQPSADV